MIELVLTAIPAVISVCAVIYGVAKIKHDVDAMKEALVKINHNTSKIILVLVAKGLLDPEDIKEVGL